jgi:cation diffusion facilitator family transporter
LVTNSRMFESGDRSHGARKYHQKGGICQKIGAIIKAEFFMQKQQRLTAATISLFVAVLILALKFWAYHVTGSQAVFSDAMESIVNVIAALSLISLLKIASKPADEDHPYGHGKAEFFSSAFEGGLITFAAFLIVAQAVGALISGNTLLQLEVGIIIVLGAGVANLLLGLYLVSVGKRLKSLALVASGKHVISDFWTSAGTVVALVLVHLTGWVWLDATAALLLGGYLGRTGFQLLRESTEALMDAENTTLLRHILELFSRHRTPGIIRIHYTRVIRSGRYHHIDAHVVVPEFWEVQKAHEETNTFEQSVIQDYEYDGEIHFHVDPCRRAYCRACDLPSCPVRQEPFREKIQFTIEELRSPVEPEAFK